MNKVPHAMSMYYYLPAGTPMYPVKTIHTFQNSYGDVDNNNLRRVVPFSNGSDWWGDWVRHTAALLVNSKIDYDRYWEIHIKHSKKEIFLSPAEIMTPVYNIIPPYDQQFYFVPLTDHPMWYGYLVERSLFKIFNGNSI